MPLSSDFSDLIGFELLLSVAQTGSVGAAARAHGMTQPAASARLSRMERRLGLQLLDRTARGSHLTDNGMLVADWARVAVEAAAALEAGVASLRRDAHSQLSIAASMTVAEYLLPHWLVALRQSGVKVEASLTTGNSEDAAQAVLSGSADIGFVEGPDVPAGLAGRVVARDELTVIAPHAHPWTARRRGITAAELAATPLVCRERGSGTRSFLEATLQAGSAGPIAAPLLELPSTTAIKTAVAEGLGPAVLSSLAVAADIATGVLVAVPVQGVDLTRPMRLVHVPGRALVGPARDLAALAGRR